MLCTKFKMLVLFSMFIVLIIINIQVGFIQFYNVKRPRLGIYSNAMKKELTAVHSGEKSANCPRLSLYKYHEMLDIPYGTCEPHRPTDLACEYAKKLYTLDPKLTRCKGTEIEKQICRIQTQESHVQFTIVCNRSLCSELGVNDNMNFRAYMLDPRDGELRLKKGFSTVHELEQGLKGILQETIRNKFHFVFLRCKSRYGWRREEISQLLPVDPQIILQQENSTRSANILNVNILLLDSASRAHFYRSLPRTINTFKQWVNNPSTSPASIFDFELFQAVHGHTKEVMHALFTGRLVPPNSGSRSSVEMEVLFGHYKRAGYQTVWQEDLCFKEVWGLLLDLAATNWKTLQTKLQKSFIDHTGITHSSCEVLKANGVGTPFSGPSGDQICYNGRFQHSYFLRSVVDTINAISQSSLARPLLSYMSLSVAHDHRGRRIQSLDNDLVQYVTDIARDSNTLTIMLADHGNTYTHYTNAIMEGRFEMFHPHLFLIVPKRVAGLLGVDAMEALQVNQRRLVSAFDLHHSLMTLAGPILGKVKRVGLFAPVPINKTCDDIELRTPNLCVCEGWDSPTKSDPIKLGLVEFAIGELNNKIQDQYSKSLKGSKPEKQAHQACERLKPFSFRNPRVRNSKSDGSLITSFEVRVKAGNVAPQDHDAFHLEVQTLELPDKFSLGMKLRSFERISLFENYRKCADEDVDLKLCICSENATESVRKTRLNDFPWHTYLKYFGQAPTFAAVDHHCVFLTRREHDKRKAFAFELINRCEFNCTVAVDVTEMSNVRLSRSVPFEVEIWPSSVRFVLSVQRFVYYWKSSVQVSAKLVSLKN